MSTGIFTILWEQPGVYGNAAQKHPVHMAQYNDAWGLQSTSKRGGRT